MAERRRHDDPLPEGSVEDEVASGSDADEIRRRLRALYRAIENEPLPDDLRALAERLQSEKAPTEPGSRQDDDAG